MVISVHFSLPQDGEIDTREPIHHCHKNVYSVVIINTVEMHLRSFGMSFFLNEINVFNRSIMDEKFYHLIVRPDSNLNSHGLIIS